MSKQLTALQTATFKFIIEYIDSHGYPPTVREISEHFRVQLHTISCRIDALKKKGYITVDAGRARAIRVERSL